MTEALGSGWLVALVLGIPAFLTAVVTVARWVAEHWRRPLEREIAEKKHAQDKLDAALETLANERLRCMFMEAKNAALEQELEHWRSGRWTKHE